MDDAPVNVAAVPKFELNGIAVAIACLRGRRRRLGTGIRRGIGMNWNGCAALIRFGSTAAEGRSSISK